MRSGRPTLPERSLRAMRFVALSCAPCHALLVGTAYSARGKHCLTMCATGLFPADANDFSDTDTDAALLQARRRIGAVTGWTRAVLDGSGATFWWRDVPGSDEPEVRFSDPSASEASASGDQSETSSWRPGVLESGAAYWWRDNEAEPDGIELRYDDPAAG